MAQDGFGAASSVCRQVGSQFAQPGTAVAEAAIRLASGLQGVLDGGLSLNFPPAHGLRFLDPDLLTALAPLATKLLSITLDRWAVNDTVLNSLVLSLPGVRFVKLEKCVVDNSFWQMLPLCSTLEVVSFSFKSKFNLPQFYEFSSRFPWAMDISVARSCLGNAGDWEALQTFAWSLGEQRRLACLAPIQIHCVDAVL